MKTTILSILILLFLTSCSILNKNLETSSKQENTSVNEIKNDLVQEKEVASKKKEDSSCNIIIKKFLSSNESYENPDIQRFYNKNRIVNFKTLASCEWWEKIFENLDFWEISWIQKYSYSDFLWFVWWFLPPEETPPLPIHEETINTSNSWTIYIAKYEWNKYYINFSVEYIDLKLWTDFKPVYVENIDEVIKDFKLISSTLQIYSEDPIWDWSLLESYDIQFLSCMSNYLDEDLVDMYWTNNRNGFIANYLWKQKVIYIKNSDRFENCCSMWIACESSWFDKDRNALKIHRWSVNYEEWKTISDEYYFVNVDTWEVSKN